MHHKLTVGSLIIVSCLNHIFFLVNSRYDLGIKNALISAGGTGFTFPACSTVPAYVVGGVYPGNNKVWYDGFVWSASACRPQADHSSLDTFGRINGGHRLPPFIAPIVIGWKVCYLTVRYYLLLY
jgi:hypothetical protein